MISNPASFHPVLDSGERGVARWLMAGTVILAVHVGGAWVVMNWPHEPPPAAEPPAAIMVELAPLPAAPEAPPIETPPAPPMVEAKPEQVLEPEPIVEEEPLPDPVIEPPPVEWPPPVEIPELTAPVESEAVLAPPPPPKPKPKPKRKPQPKKVEKAEKTPEEKVAPTTTAPSAVAAPRAAVNAAPVNSSTPSVSAAQQSFQGALHAHLNRHKRYPRSAQIRRQQGSPVVRFVVDGEGNVLSVQLVRSSGHDQLDQEALSLPTRASPVPAPPPEMMKGPTITFTVPIPFSLR